MSANAIAWLGRQIAWEARLDQLRKPSVIAPPAQNEVAQAA